MKTGKQLLILSLVSLTLTLVLVLSPAAGAFFHSSPFISPLFKVYLPLIQGHDEPTPVATDKPAAVQLSTPVALP